MTIVEFKKKLKQLNIPKSWYSIDGDIKSDTHILNKVHTYWEYFYFDEKGEEQGYVRFDNEAEACDYLYHILIEDTKHWTADSIDNSNHIKNDILDVKCLCNELSSCDIISAKQLNQIKNFFDVNLKKHIFFEDNNKYPFYEWSDGEQTISYIAQKWYRCKICGCLWEFNYSDFPPQGFLHKFEDGIYKVD